MLSKLEPSYLEQIIDQENCKEMRALINDEALYLELIKSNASQWLNPPSKVFLDVITMISTVINIWWAITALVPLSFIPVGALSLFALSITILSGIISAVYSYSQQQKQIQNTQEIYQLIAIKQAIAEQLSKKYCHLDIQNTLTTTSPPTWDTFVYGFSTSTMILLSFCWGLTEILVSFNYLAAAAMITSSLGLFIGVSLSIGIGIYAGLIHFKNAHYENLINNHKQFSEIIINKTITAYRVSAYYSKHHLCIFNNANPIEESDHLIYRSNAR